MECHQYGISLFIPQKSFCKETSNGVAKWQLHFQAKYVFKMQSAHYFPSLIALSLTCSEEAIVEIKTRLNVWNVNHSKTKRPLYEYNVLRQLLVEFEGIRLVDLI